MTRQNFSHSFLFSIILLLSSSCLFSQVQNDEQETSIKFAFDAVVFRSGDSSAGRVDVFILAPYQSLNFVKSKAIYAAKYSVNIKIKNKDGKEVENKYFEKVIKEGDYFVSQGGTGKFDFSQSIFTLAPGSYEIDVALTDEMNKRQTTKSREIAIVDFSKFQTALSGIMFVSAIEEKDGKFIITPHVSDNVGDLTEGFFVFFEVYSKAEGKTIDVVYEIRDGSNSVRFKSSKIPVNLQSGKTQQYIKIKMPSDLAQGNFKIRLIALKEGSPEEWSDGDYAAASERTVKYFKTIGGIVLADIDKAIKQLRYVASGDEMDFIEEAKEPDERNRRFEEFWKTLDPTPNTDRNEAFEEYFSRIDYANKNFRSYAEGWKTDKGMVFVVYGRPNSVDKNNSYGDSRAYEKWNYMNNKQFVFVDNNGFGDFRLYSPMTVTDKYRYEK